MCALKQPIKQPINQEGSCDSFDCAAKNMDRIASAAFTPIGDEHRCCLGKQPIKKHVTPINSLLTPLPPPINTSNTYKQPINNLFTARGRNADGTVDVSQGKKKSCASFDCEGAKKVNGLYDIYYNG